MGESGGCVSSVATQTTPGTHLTPKPPVPLNLSPHHALPTLHSRTSSVFTSVFIYLLLSFCDRPAYTHTAYTHTAYTYTAYTHTVGRDGHQHVVRAAEGLEHGGAGRGSDGHAFSDEGESYAKS